MRVCEVNKVFLYSLLTLRDVCIILCLVDNKLSKEADNMEDQRQLISEVEKHGFIERVYERPCEECNGTGSLRVDSYTRWVVGRSKATSVPCESCHSTGKVRTTSLDRVPDPTPPAPTCMNCDADIDTSAPFFTVGDDPESGHICDTCADLDEQEADTMEDNYATYRQTMPQLTTIQIVPGELYTLTMPYAEVNMQLCIAGRIMRVMLMENERTARLFTLLGDEIGVVSYGEAGIYRSYAGGFYAYVPATPAKLPAPIEPGTVIEATMRPEDLIPAFMAVLAEHRPDEARALENTYSSVFAALAHSELGPLDPQDDEHIFLLDELFDAMNELAPRGMYFGAHMGDGSDYGFWPINEEVSM